MSQTQELILHDIQRRLEIELSSLKSKFGLGGQLQVVWDPRHSFEETHGRVQGSKIFVYDVYEEEALHTLKHEYIEYILTREFLEPRIFEMKAHRRTDALVDIIVKLTVGEKKYV